jgi:hypothetical protein
MFFALGGVFRIYPNNSALLENNVHYITNCTFLNNQVLYSSSSCRLDVFVSILFLLTNSYIYGYCTDQNNTIYISGIGVQEDLLSASCSSPLSPSLNTCPPSFFLSMDQLSCVRDCFE